MTTGLYLPNNVYLSAIIWGWRVVFGVLLRGFITMGAVCGGQFFLMGGTVFFQQLSMQ
ncbi:hypothetical protein [[Limnothrix rosea] IAM M-220]|uniref:hypothetical protein n=1 Tax=[Limnothrix rosea] IAM M-220 TaxID=454133 RepID=UPI0015C548C0|nr:hypothetical protein [[Limnothrix rosea] IAM M-220]